MQSENNTQVQKEPEQVLAVDDVKIEIDTNAPRAKVEIPPRKQSDAIDDGIMRISNKEKSMRARIGYLMGRLGSGLAATLTAYGQAVNKALLIANIIRSKLGDIHMVISLQDLKDEKRESQGIRIVLSKEVPANTDDIGYQVAEAKGFWQRRPRQKKEQTDEKQKRAKSSDNKAAKKDKKDQDADDKKSVKSRRRSQSARRPAKDTKDKKDQSRSRSKPATVKEEVEAKTRAQTPKGRRRNERKARDASRADDKQQSQQVKGKRDQPDDKKDDKKPRRQQRRREARKDEKPAQESKENQQSQRQQSGRQSARGGPEREKQTSFQKSWANDDDNYFYEGYSNRNRAREHEQDRDQNQPPRRAGGGPRGGYGGQGGQRRPMQYEPFGYPPMRQPYFGNQGYFMYRQPYLSHGYNNNRYYNQPGYQKGANTREIGQNQQTTSHGGQSERSGMMGGY